jgi:hypothetical protein
MAVDRVETFWYLTPNGWIAGSIDSMWTGLKTVEPPTDCVETWVQNLSQQSSYSPESNIFRLIWFSPTISVDERKVLHERFPSSDEGPC